MGKKPSTIALIGMFGAGKSLYGEMLANDLDLSMHDIDLVWDAALPDCGYANREDLLVTGDDSLYLLLENFELYQTNISPEKIIAPPGSIAYHGKDRFVMGRRQENIHRLWKKQGVKFVYLDISLDELISRNPDVMGRGVVTPDKNIQALRGTPDFILALYAERTPIFEDMADITISLQDGLSIPDTYQMITYGLPLIK